ncbi:MAG TPA: hypothetical protein DCE42_04510 [Myxococcales bacterium]|nr:hypothetical protein [Myxococcales bacterium]
MGNLSRYIRIFLSVPVCMLLFVTLSHATPARMDGLNNSPFFRDDTDVFAYPGVLTQHSNKLILNADPSQTTGSAGVLFGKRLGLGVFFNRAATNNDLGEVVRLFDLAPSIGQARRLVDVVGSFRLGKGQAFGVGLGFSSTLSSATNATTDTRSNRTSGVTASVFELYFGYSMKQRNLRLDIGGEVTFNTFSVVRSSEIQYEGSLVPSFSLKGRGFLLLRERVDLAFELIAARRSYQVNVPVHSSVADYSRLNVQAMVGPAFQILRAADVQKDGDKKAVQLPPLAARFVGGVLIGYEVVGGATSFGPSGLGEARFEQSVGAFLFPGFHAALEASLGKHFSVRMGVTARYFFTNASGVFPRLREPINSSEPSNTDPAETASTQQTYSWGAGLTFSLAGFSFDASFEAPFFTDGPNFLGGKSPGLFATASLSYVWK